MDLQPLCVELRELAADCIREAESRGVFFAFAESCTGGLLGATVTWHSGSSVAFAGSAVTYSNEAKEKILGVPHEIIEHFGAVSEPCARAMAEGARSAYGAYVAVSVTGVAGPLGGSPEKPVGTVWFGVSRTGCEASAFCRRFEGDRAAVRSQGAREALLSLLAALREK